MENTASIRKAGKDDLDAILEIWWQLAMEHEDRDPEFWGVAPNAKEIGREYFATVILDPSHLVLVAEIGGRVVGFAHGSPLERRPVFRTAKGGRVDEVAVHRDYRRRGLGRQIMEVLVRGLGSMGFSFIELMVDTENQAAIELYRSLSFYPRDYRMVRTGGDPR